jgi:preprotein translocase subunit YajC
MIIHHKLFSVVARTCLQIDIRRIMYYIKRQEKKQQQQHQKTISDIPKDK